MIYKEDGTKPQNIIFLAEKNGIFFAERKKGFISTIHENFTMNLNPPEAEAKEKLQTLMEKLANEGN